MSTVKSVPGEDVPPGDDSSATTTMEGGAATANDDAKVIATEERASVFSNTLVVSKHSVTLWIAFYEYVHVKMLLCLLLLF